MSAVCQRTERSSDLLAPNIVDLDDLRVGRLTPGIIDELRGRGTAVASVEGGDLDRWRRAARRAGRVLGWHVRTGVSDGRAWVTSDDWEAPAGSDQIAANLFCAVVSGSRPLARVVPIKRSPRAGG